jgi:enterochelin esterase family protein
MPDCITAYGGSQYVNSTATGRYDDYIVQELVPLVDGMFRTNGRHGVFGGSSGGIGAFTLAAKHPDVFQGFADHSGDSGFESCYLNDIPAFVQAIAKYDHDLEKFVRSIPSTVDPRVEGFDVLSNFVGMASCYGANPDAPLGFELPFDLYTGKMDWAKWEQWRRHDPVNMVAPYAGNLRKLKFRYVDCGTRDQFHLYLGARQRHEQLDAHGIEHIYEEYDSDHFIMRRQQEKKTIPMLAKALSD